MLPYWLMFTLWTVGTLRTGQQRGSVPAAVFFIASTFFTGLMIAFRFKVGGDWGNYLRIYYDIALLSFRQAISTGDAGYSAINWIAAQNSLGIVLVNSICAFLFIGGLSRLASRQQNPALAMLVAVPYLIIVVAMGYTRQAAAIGVVCFAIADATERRIVRLTILILAAALFHKTAILVLPIALIPVFRRNVLLGAIGTVGFIILAVLLLRDSADEMMRNYVQGDLDSQGAAVRIGMNVLAAIVFLYFRERITVTEFQRSFWISCSILSLLSVAALLSLSASAGLDRLSLYLIPLQIVTYAQLPYIVGNDGRAVPSVLIGVIGYSFLVQFVWLNYADNVQAWLPYSMSLYNVDV